MMNNAEDKIETKKMNESYMRVAAEVSSNVNSATQALEKGASAHTRHTKIEMSQRTSKAWTGTTPRPRCSPRVRNRFSCGESQRRSVFQEAIKKYCINNY
jgi:hypothetical protein